MVTVKEITTKTCGVCKMLKPAIQKIFDELGDKASITVYDSEDEEIKPLIEEYGIKEVPAFFIYKDGTLIDKHFGPVNPLLIRKTIMSLIG